MAKIVTIGGAPFRPRGFVAQTLAEWIARKRIKQDWRASGRHRYDLGRAELNRAASVYLFQHEELFEKAKAMIERGAVLKRMAEAERKRACKYLK